jgi:predicted RNA binding protein YcfA (HicA-like mRNA interferase family)
MSGKHGPMRPKEVAKLLRSDGWTIKCKGPGDHVQYVHPTKRGKVTLDMGADPIPTGTLRSIYYQAGWEW